MTSIGAQMPLRSTMPWRHAISFPATCALHVNLLASANLWTSTRYMKHANSSFVNSTANKSQIATISSAREHVTPLSQWKTRRESFTAGAIIGKWFIVKRASAIETGAPLSTSVGIYKLSPQRPLPLCIGETRGTKKRTFYAIFCMASLITKVEANKGTLSTVSKTLCLTRAQPMAWSHSVCLLVALFTRNVTMGKLLNEPHALKWLQTRGLICCEVFAAWKVRKWITTEHASGATGQASSDRDINWVSTCTNLIIVHRIWPWQLKSTFSSVHSDPQNACSLRKNFTSNPLDSSQKYFTWDIGVQMSERYPKICAFFNPFFSDGRNNWTVPRCVADGEISYLVRSSYLTGRGYGGFDGLKGTFGTKPALTG